MGGNKYLYYTDILIIREHKILLLDIFWFSYYLNKYKSIFLTVVQRVRGSRNKILFILWIICVNNKTYSPGNSCRRWRIWYNLLPEHCSWGECRIGQSQSRIHQVYSKRRRVQIFQWGNYFCYPPSGKPSMWNLPKKLAIHLLNINLI